MTMRSLRHALTLGAIACACADGSADGGSSVGETGTGSDTVSATAAASTADEDPSLTDASTASNTATSPPPTTDASGDSGDPSSGADESSSDGGPSDGHGTCGMGGPVVDSGLESVDLLDAFYYVAAPPSDPQQPWPLVVVLHGDEGSPDAVASMWSPLWDSRQDFVVVLPQSPAPSASWWNADVDANEQFLRAVLADVASQHNIDIERIYATGVSGGSTFLGFRAFRMQDIFAAMQLSCGGGGADYQAPPQPGCEIPARFVISPSDFLYDYADSIRDTMDANGHETEWLDAPCDGHCCGPVSEYSTGALDWMLAHRKCGGWDDQDCGEIDELP